MNILGCLDHPSEGTYGRRPRHMLDSDELAQLRREHFGFVFQRYLLPRVDAVANLEMPAIYAGTPRAERHARARELLARLEPRIVRTIGPATVRRPAAAREHRACADERRPGDPRRRTDRRARHESGKDVIRILHELNALGHTIVIVTHDKAVARHAKRIIEISDGEIVADRPNRHYAEALAEAGVDAAEAAEANEPEASALPPAITATRHRRPHRSTPMRIPNPAPARDASRPAPALRRSVPDGMDRARIAPAAHAADDARHHHRHHVGRVDRRDR